MKVYRRIIATTSCAMCLLFVGKISHEYLQINQTLSKIVQETSNALTKLTIAHRNSVDMLEDEEKHVENSDVHIENNYNLENKIFKQFYNIENFTYNIGIYELKNKNSNENIKNAIKFLNSNDKKYYYKKISENRYIFAKKASIKNITTNIKPKQQNTLIAIFINASKLKSALIKQYWANVYLNFFMFLLTFIFMFFTIKLVYRKDEKYVNTLKKEMKSQTQEINEKNQEIEFRLLNDALTSLPNRNTLLKTLRQTESENVTLALINIDNFKEINDFYGFEVGDEVLISFASFLKLYANDFFYSVYKLHADEYALLWEIDDNKNIETYIKELLASIKNFSVITEGDHNVEIEVSIGIASGKENIFSRSDLVLKRAKTEQMPYLFFERTMDVENEYKHSIEWAKEIRQAIKHNDILAYVQPIANTKDKSIVKYEVLVRMKNEVGKIISPYIFLEVAKKNKLYSYITRKVVSESFKHFADTKYQFSINLSILDILNQVTVTYIINRLERFPDPSRITFEILESEGIENYKQVVKFIELVKKKGCKIAIDDFGSGYSNFEHMLRLQVDLIKIDASLIKSIDTNRNAQVIVQTIVSFANKLGIATCAEYVHSQEVYDKLIEIGTTFVQGYYISEPFPIENVK